MKFAKCSLIALFLVAFASTAFAQGAAMDTTAKPMAHKSATMKSPEDMAKEALAKWKTSLKLTAEQEPQFESIMTDSYKKMSEAKTEAAGDKAKMKASMETIMKDREDALSKVLTPDQMKTYQAQVKKNVKSAHKAMSKSSSAK